MIGGGIGGGVPDKYYFSPTIRIPLRASLVAAKRPNAKK